MKKGFTLIELLVVVLIIGILSAVALPQYEKAVEKSKAIQALSLLKSVYLAQEAFLLANGDYANDFDLLDVKIPWAKQGEKRRSEIVDFRANEDWMIDLYRDSATFVICIYRQKGPFKGTGFVISGRPPNPSQPGVLYCEDISSTGKYCRQIFNGELVRSGSKYTFKMAGW